MDDDVIGYPLNTTVSPAERDRWIRTVVGEAGNDPSATAVAYSIANRLRSGKFGKTLGQVITPGQYETWATPQGRANASVPVNSPAYKNAADIVDGIIAGKTLDPTGGATHFYAPITDPITGVNLGENPPAWGKNGTRIGGHYFSAPLGPVMPVATAGGDAASAIEAAAPTNAPPAPSGALAFSSGPAKTMPKTTPAQSPSAPSQPQAGSPPAKGVSTDDLAKMLSGGDDDAGDAPLSTDDLAKALDSTSEAPTAAPSKPSGSPVTFVHNLKGILNNAPKTPEGNSGDDMVSSTLKNVGTGAIKGLADIPGAPGNSKGFIDYLLDRAESAITGQPLETVQQKNALNQQKVLDSERQFWSGIPGGAIANALVAPPPTGAQIAAPILAQTGEYKPETGFGQAAQAAVEGTTAGVGLGAGNFLSNPKALLTLKPYVAPAAASYAGSVGTQMSGDPLVGMAASLVPGLAARGVTGAASRLAGTTDPNTAMLADKAINKYDIPVRAGQISGSFPVRLASSTTGRIPFSGAGALAGQQQTAFNRAVAGEMNAPRSGGTLPDKITPDVMQATKNKLGGTLNRIAARTNTVLDPAYTSDVNSILNDASTVLETTKLPPLQKIAGEIQNLADPNTNTLTGSAYQTLTRHNGPLDLLMNNQDPSIKFFASRIRNALDDAMERSTTKYSSSLLKKTRSQYKVMKTIEDVVEKSPNGDISPALLMGRVRNSYGNMAYNGAGPLGDLSRIGQRFLKEPGSSNTSERAFQNLLALGAGGLGLHELGLTPSPEVTGPAIGAVLSSMLGARMINKGLNSQWLTNALLNRSLGTPIGPPVTNLLANSAPYALQVGETAGSK